MTTVRRPPRTALSLCIPAMMIAAAERAAGQSVYFDDSAAFLAAAGEPWIDSFEDAIVVPFCRWGVAIERPAFTASTDQAWRIANGDELGMHASQGARYLSNCFQEGTLVFHFVRALTAFGLDIIDFGDGYAGGAIWIALDGGDPHLIASAPPARPDGQIIFAGVVTDTPFREARITSTGHLDNVGLDAIRMTPYCPADFNDDGFLDFFDFDAFMNCFEGIECPPAKDADFDGDRFVDFFDADAFLEAFESGC